MMTWPAFDPLPLDAFVTTRAAGSLSLAVEGNSDQVIRDRSRVAAAIGADPSDFVWCRQSHRPVVQVVTSEHRGRGAFDVNDSIPDTDAMVTDVAGLVLAVLAADCLPLVLVDPVAGVLAAAHAGWRGTVQGVTSATVAAMVTLGADPARIVAGLGPAVSPDRYQVGSDVLDAATVTFGARVGEVVRPDGTGRWVFDLWRANALQLEQAGLDSAHIHVSGQTTGPETPFYSHRFEAPTGRIAAVARLRP